MRCLVCGNDFKAKGKRKHTAKYCSRKCHYYTKKGVIPKGFIIKKGHCSNTGRTHFKIGFTPWNKGKKTGIVPKTAYTKGDKRILNENHYMWKGESVGYYGLHLWIKSKKGSPAKCSKCGSSKNVQWASKTYKYTRDLDDWIELCYMCHRRYDRDNGWGIATYKFPQLKRKYA